MIEHIENIVRDGIKNGKPANEMYDMPLNVVLDLLSEREDKSEEQKGDIFDMF